MLSGRCEHHPDRTAVGVCVICRTVICIECSTPIEGIHRCHRCIERMGRTRRRSVWDGRESHPGVWALLLVSLGGLTLYWLGLSTLLWNGP